MRSLLLEWKELLDSGKGSGMAIADVERRAVTKSRVAKLFDWESPRLRQAVESRAQKEEFNSMEQKALNNWGGRKPWHRKSGFYFRRQLCQHWSFDGRAGPVEREGGVFSGKVCRSTLKTFSSAS